MDVRRLGKWEGGSHGSPLARRAGYAQPASQLTRELAALIGADAEAAGLRRYEGPEQSVANEVSVHARTVILDLDDRAGAIGCAGELDADEVRRGFDRILQQVADDG